MEAVNQPLTFEALGFKVLHITVTTESGEVVFDGPGKGAREIVEAVSELRHVMRRGTTAPQSGKHRARWLRKRPWKIL